MYYWLNCERALSLFLLYLKLWSNASNYIRATTTFFSMIINEPSTKRRQKILAPKRRRIANGRQHIFYDCCQSIKSYKFLSECSSFANINRRRLYQFSYLFCKKIKPLFSNRRQFVDACRRCIGHYCRFKKFTLYYENSHIDKYNDRRQLCVRIRSSTRVDGR